MALVAAGQRPTLCRRYINESEIGRQEVPSKKRINLDYSFTLEIQVGVALCSDATCTNSGRFLIRQIVTFYFEKYLPEKIH